MAEFQEVMAHFKRMCEYNQHKQECPMGCIMSDMNRPQCMREAFEKPKTTEKTIMAWAAEHQEPVYPMWCEWLADKGVVDVARMPVDYSGGIVTEIKPSGKMYARIPADIAQKLGIEPKEG